MTKKRKLPQTGGQYQRDKKGNPVPHRTPKPAEPAKADKPLEKE